MLRSMQIRWLIRKSVSKIYLNSLSSMHLSRRPMSTTISKLAQEPAKLGDYSKERMEQMTEYFNQYVEEYYEEVVEEEKQEPVIEKEVAKPVKSSISEITMEEVVDLLKEHRAQNIVSIEVEPTKGPHPYVVICTPYNDRHAVALVQTIRKHLKELYFFEDYQMPQHNKITAGWVIFDLRNVVLHILTENLREKYNLEALYTNESDESTSDYDDAIPPPKNQATI